MSKTIVWLDDDTAIIEPVVRPLQLAGYHFIRIRTVAEALDAIDTIRHADLLLLDMIVPPGPIEREFSRYPGRDFLRELREIHRVDVPVVVLSVVTRDDVQLQLHDLGVLDIVRKPVRPTELKRRVEEALARATQ